MTGGSAIVFDHRVVHRGTANTAVGEHLSAEDRQRPMLYLTFAKPWFTDSVNFPTESVFDEQEEELEEEEEEEQDEDEEQDEGQEQHNDGEKE